MKYIWVMGVALILLVSTKALAHGDMNTTVVHMDENGFSPNALEIKAGTIVEFENVGKNTHWPASDDHPSHTNYDGTTLEKHCADKNIVTFDACSEMQPNSSWSFTFNKAGTYKYHDHMWPQFSGTVVVVDKPAQQPPAVQQSL